MRKYTSYGYRDGNTVNHYGVVIDVETPVTGVVCNNEVPGLGDAIFEADAIDLAMEEHLSECSEEYHDSCGPDERGTVLIGAWLKDEEGKYSPDTKGVFAAIVNELTIQVVFSKHTKRVRLCSPCYPGQGDLDSPCEDGGVLAFDLPPEMYQGW